MTIKEDIFEYAAACLGSVAFRTNGPQGGDAGHGGYLEIVFDTQEGSTALEVDVNGEEVGDVDTVTLRFRGDAEMEAARQCFQFLADSLKPR